MTAQVYLCLDQTDSLIYVGLSTQATARLAHHRRVTPWWPEVARMVVGCRLPYAAAARLEKALIAGLQPTHNRAFKDGLDQMALARAARRTA